MHLNPIHVCGSYENTFRYIIFRFKQMLWTRHYRKNVIHTYVKLSLQMWYRGNKLVSRNKLRKHFEVYHLSDIVSGDEIRVFEWSWEGIPEPFYLPVLCCHRISRTGNKDCGLWKRSLTRYLVVQRTMYRNKYLYILLLPWIWYKGVRNKTRI